MNYVIKISISANKDEEEAYNYYESKRPGLGEEFLEAVERKYATLAENPYLFGYVTQDGPLRDVKVDHL